VGRHRYIVVTEWSGNRGTGTAGYRSYDRSHVIRVAGKPPLLASSDPAFRGDPERYNPEDLLVASLSGCHMLWYLHLCTDAGIVVVEYVDEASGTMVHHEDGGEFVEVVLRPRVVVADDSMVDRAQRLHTEAHRRCFIARSVNFPVTHEAVVTVQGR
jgi:organic hydroperoxide reductase OsmC/OhrA